MLHRIVALCAALMFASSALGAISADPSTLTETGFEPSGVNANLRAGYQFVVGGNDLDVTHLVAYYAAATLPQNATIELYHVTGALTAPPIAQHTFSQGAAGTLVANDVTANSNSQQYDYYAYSIDISHLNLTMLMGETYGIATNGVAGRINRPSDVTIDPAISFDAVSGRFSEAAVGSGWLEEMDILHFGYGPAQVSQLAGAVVFDVVPEPASLALVGVGALLVLRRRAA